VPPNRVARLLDALQDLRMSAEHEALGRSGQLTAAPERLSEVLAVAIDEAAEALSADCTRLLRGTGSAAEVRAGVDELSGLLDLLGAVEGR
jgi:hypothetical protein